MAPNLNNTTPCPVAQSHRDYLRNPQTYSFFTAQSDPSEVKRITLNFLNKHCYINNVPKKIFELLFLTFSTIRFQGILSLHV